MLPTAEWLAQAEELPVGSRRRVNHLCGGGRTLLVEHKADGYSAWCHRCSDKGWHPHPTPSLAERIARLTAERASDSAAEARMAPPVPTEWNPSLWPLPARVWLYKAGFSNDAIQQNGFYYAEHLARVVLPVLQGDTVTYWQARGFDPSRPKYLNPIIDKPLAWYGDTGPTVITEDILSAARVGEVATGVSLLGTSIPDRHLSSIRARSAAGVLVWLDPDLAGRKGRSRVARQLALAGLTPRIIRTPLDPKYYSKSQIEELISSA